MSAFAALVFFNYVVQTTFVPNLARHYTLESAAILATFSMSNPTPAGLLGFMIWNALVFVMSCFTLVALRRRAL